MTQVTFDFYEDANAYSAEQTEQLFAPHRLWGVLRDPTHHTVLLGVPGSGKTMLLKRLSWPAMTAAPAFRRDASFAAFYVNLRPMTRLSEIEMSKTIRSEDPAGVAQKSIISYVGSMYLIRSICEDLLEANQRPAVLRDHMLVTKAFLRSCRALLKEKFDDIRGIYESIGSKLDNIVDQMVGGVSSKELTAACIPALSPSLVMIRFSMALDAENAPFKLGILFDQYEHLSADEQMPFNAAITRERADEFFVVVAVVPYGFYPKGPRGRLRPGHDYRYECCDYFESEFEAYLGLIEQMWEKLRPEGPRLGRILQGGPEYLARASSRSLRIFLRLCEHCGAFKASYSDLIPYRAQLAEVQKEAIDLEERLREGPEHLPKEVIRSLVNLVAPAPKRNSKTANRTAIYENGYGSVIWKDPGFRGAPELSSAALDALRAGFAEGAFLFDERQHVRIRSAPPGWRLSPLLLTAQGYESTSSKKYVLESKKLERVVSRRGRPQTKVALRGIHDLRKVFLSFRFEDSSRGSLLSSGLEEEFENRGAKVITGHPVGGESRTGPAGTAGANLLQQVISRIDSAQVMLADFTELTPNIAFEIGCAYGLGKRVIPLRFKDHRGRLDSSRDFESLVNFSLVAYSLNQDHLRSLVDKVLSHLHAPPSPEEMLVKSQTKQPIRVRKEKPKSISIYYPDKHRDAWSRVIGVVQSASSDRGYTCRVVNLLPNKKAGRILENLIWCFSKAHWVLADTSDSDLLASFGLGYSHGRSHSGSTRQIFRIEMCGAENIDALSMLPSGFYSTWSKPEDVTHLIETLLPHKGRR